MPHTSFGTAGGRHGPDAATAGRRRPTPRRPHPGPWSWNAGGGEVCVATNSASRGVILFAMSGARDGVIAGGLQTKGPATGVAYAAPLGGRQAPNRLLGTDFRCGARADAVRPDARRRTCAAIWGCARNYLSLRLFTGNDAALVRCPG